jgi:large subunit ribosomal protein L13
MLLDGATDTSGNDTFRVEFQGRNEAFRQQKIRQDFLHAPRRTLKTAETRSKPTMSTTIPSGKDIKRKWYVLDASGKTLGRLATQAASMLAGKLNPLYTPYIDVGDHVIIVNAEKIVLTGMKGEQKLYRRYTGFPGGLREESFVKLLARRPEAIVEQAVKGMLPKSKLGRQMATKLKVYKGGQHPHLAQQPVPYEFHASNAPKAGAAGPVHAHALEG